MFSNVTVSTRTPPLIRILIINLAALVVANSVWAQNDLVSFTRDIRPILSDKCFHCHGPDENTREADLRFDDHQSALNVIEPGDVVNSELILRILEEDPDLRMPPAHVKKPLQPAEIELLKRWVDQGADWSEFWAYVPPRWHEVPTPIDRGWSANWIDQMILSRIEKNGLRPSPAADRVTLARRLHFDLIGLPPTPEQVQSFVSDDRPDAYLRLVTELLESKHFGERMAMYWLDLVRYADTVGYHGDQDHNISPYRDWVINAFNENLPFDQFTREQLAGDLLPQPTLSQKIASGYNRLLQTTHEGGLQPGEYRAIYAADRVRNVSAVWMGATVGCAQCHDHKYDPYTTRDFYSLAAFFADIDDEAHFKNGTNSLPTRRSPEILILDEDDQRKWDRIKPLADEAKRKLDSLKNSQKKKQSQLTRAEEKGLTEEQESLSRELNDLDKEIEAATAGHQALAKQAQQIESRGAWTMISQPLDVPRTVRVLPRGNWLDESGPVVGPAVPEFLGAIETAERATRLDLANWLTDADTDIGKLTARVFVNRVFYLLMGVGISRSLDDFGGQGMSPSYPELLDNLAIDFARDWDVKRLVRQIVATRTYRQSSMAAPEVVNRDPYNEFFARQSRYRLPAEMVRDLSLAVSGLLNVDQVGGKSIKPYQPAGYYRHLNFPPRKYKQTTDARQWRRGVYVHWQRMFLHPSLKALDAPSREECTCERPRSNTPLAALALLNDPSFVEAARVFAEKIMQHEAGFGERLRFAYQWAVSREPQPDEIELMRSLYRESLTEYQSDRESCRLLLSVGQAPLNEDLPGAELAAWTTVARALLNTSEAITRN